MQLSHIFNSDIENYHVNDKNGYFYRRECNYFGKLLAVFKKKREFTLYFLK